MSAPSDYEQLRDLLISPEVNALRSVQDEVERVKRLLHDPDHLAQLLRPMLADLIRDGNPALSLAIARAITPVLDQAVRERTLQDTAGMADALAPVSTSSIALHYTEAPAEAARDLAPLVSGAIKEQIRGERDAVVDVLYPIIGSTISKYISQTLSDLIQTINGKIESNFTFRGLSRKIRAKMAGISQAELLLRESLSPRIAAALLIHKASGLIIAQSQSADSPPLDPDLLSGMLTAIRSLFNDSMDSQQTARELDQIEYGEWKIILESAGHCYLAAVVRGVPDEDLRTAMRETLSSIVQGQADAVEQYTGNPSTVPREIPQAVDNFVHRQQTQTITPPHRRTPYAFAVAALLVLALVGIGLWLRISRDSKDREVEARATTLLQAGSLSPLNGITVKADREILTLAGQSPNEYQRSKAVTILSHAFPDHRIENGITTAAVPPLPVFVESLVRERAATLNTIAGVFLNARVHGGTLAVTGFLADSSLRQAIIQSFADIPGIRSFECKLAEGAPELAGVVYFENNSAYVRPGQRFVLSDIRELLQRAPWTRLSITGHSDPKGTEVQNRALALRRAESVRQILVNMGFQPDRFAVGGFEGPPPGIAAADPDSLGRCVRFSLVPYPPETR